MFLTSGIDDSLLLLIYCFISLQRVSLDCSNFHCWSDIVMGCAGPKSADAVALACCISSFAWRASFMPGWFSAIGCRDRASAGMASPLICINSMSISFILIRRACIVLSSLRPFLHIGR